MPIDSMWLVLRSSQFSLWEAGFEVGQQKNKLLQKAVSNQGPQSSNSRGTENLA